MDTISREVKQQVERQNKGKRVVKEIISYLLYFVAIIFVTYGIIHYVGQRTEVNGQSMQDTLQNGDNLIVDKLSYRFRDPERFEIVVFPSKIEKDTYYIKRVIGLPGEVVQIDPDGRIYINGEVLDESYGKEKMKEAGLAADPIVLGEDEYFVLGDNRNDSMDSRSEYVGRIKKEELMGRAFVRIFPFDKAQILIP